MRSSGWLILSLIFITPVLPLTLEEKRQQLGATNFTEEVLNAKAVLAIQQREDAQLKYLLKIGKANPDYSTTVEKGNGSCEASLLDLAISYHHTNGEIGNHIAVSLLLDHGAKANELSAFLEERPLIYAAKLNLHREAELLISKGKVSPNITAQDGRKVLKVAQESNSFKTAEILKSHGATE